MDGTTRRRALAALLGPLVWLPDRLRAADPPLRLAISESLAGDVNRNDARVAMQVWVRKLTESMDISIDLKAMVPTEEIIEGARSGSFEGIGLNILEYRRIADIMDASQIIGGEGERGMQRYCILTKQSSGFHQLGDLKGRRLSVLKDPLMCVAPYWLGNVLEEGHYGPAERFFGSMATETKLSRVILPVFFGQTDACLTTMLGFESMTELNPQVGRDLRPIAISAPMVVAFYIFRRNCRRLGRDQVMRALSTFDTTAVGQQIGTLFHFNHTALRDGSSLASALAVLEAADRNHIRPRAVAGRGTP
jgi:phosphonate transport system substrate-binding protein